MTLENVALLSHYDIYKGCCLTGFFLAAGILSILAAC